MVFAALCAALGVVLPMAFHMVPNAGMVFLPMHIPVLLCGLLCGPVWGLACGILAPLLSHLLTSMPAAAMLPAMLCELAVYGLAAGMLFAVLRVKSFLLRTYVSLVGAMLAGRLVSGVLKALVFNVGEYSLAAWVTGSFVTCLAGIAIQLVFIPAVLLALRKAKLADVPQN